MKHSKVVVSLLLLSCASMVLADSATPYFNARSQSANVALEMVGQQGYINRYDTAGENYSVLSLAVGYQRSFRPGDIACCLFGQDLVSGKGCPQINITGSAIGSARGSKDWLADYFGLARDFSGSVKFSPQVSNVLVDLNFYMGLDSFKEGMFFEMHVPFVHTRWDLDYCETVTAKGTLSHPFGYFTGNNPGGTNGVDTSNLGNNRSELLNTARDFFSNQKVPNLSNTLVYSNNANAATDMAPNQDPLIIGLGEVSYTDAITFESLNYSRWACDALKKNGVADLRFTLGYNPYNGEKFHVGFGLTGAAPTGNRPHGEYLFEPILGNGNHWELGGQFTSHYRFWTSEDEEKHFTAYLDANLTHLFKARQTRSFDLKGKPNSRYALAQKLGESCYLHNATLQATETTNFNFSVSDVSKATAEFKNAYAPVANLTTVDVDVNIGAQIDMGLMFNYTMRNWSFDLGYNLWARTCERIKLNCDCPTRLADGATWALKGTAQVYGVALDRTKANALMYAAAESGGTVSAFQVGNGDAIDTTGELDSGNPYVLGATQSKATIHGGPTTRTAIEDKTGSFNTRNNNSIDSPRYAIAVGPVGVTSLTLGSNPNPTNVYMPLDANRTSRSDDDLNGRVFTSKNPIYLTENDLDLDGARTKGLSHKVFGHISYQWTNKDSYVPYLGLGASGEFLNASGDCCATSCSTSSSSTSSTCSTSSSSCCNTSCDSGCKRCGLSQWSVWVKGGISFN